MFGYLAADGRYVDRTFEPTGDVSELEGRLLGDAWRRIGTSGTGQAQRRTPSTITPGGERSFRLAEEISTVSGPFQAQPEVRYVPSVTATSVR